jgi:hypothetical protein
VTDPAAAIRLKVAGLTLAVRARHATSHLSLPPAWHAFTGTRGGDIHLDFVTDPVPTPRTDHLLFDSGAVWSVHRWRTGLLYTFQTPALDPPVYKAVAIDRALRRGILYYPAPCRGTQPKYALDFPLDELLFQHRLAQNGELEIHACGIWFRGRVLLFCGKSGAGKTTTARLWRRWMPEARILSDDRMVIRRRGKRYWAYGTPWHGAGGFASPGGGTLDGIFFLRHARRSTLYPVPAAESAARLFARTFPPLWDKRAVEAMVGTCAAIAGTIPCFDFGFRPDRSAMAAVLNAHLAALGAA